MIIDRIRGRLASLVPGNLAIRLDSGPLCTFTFDDCHRTSAAFGGEVLAAAGVGATYFVAGSMLDTGGNTGMLQPGDLQLLMSQGHEVGCHTFSHADVANLDAVNLQREFERNEECLASLGGVGGLVSFSYPFGKVSNLAKKLVAQRFAVARGVREGLNYGVVDLAELRACRIFHEEHSYKKVRALVRACKRSGAWLIFYTHDITDRPSRWGCTPSEFQEVLSEVLDAGVPIETMKAAVGRIMFRPSQI